MTRTGKLLAAGLLAVSLAACSGGNNNGGTTTTPPPTTPTPPPVATSMCDQFGFGDRFGAGFCLAYVAPNNSEPREVVAGDIIAVDASTEPTAL